MLETPPLALYLHFPWCVRKCPYCDFNSHTLQGELPAREYCAALIDDLDQQRAAFAGALARRPLVSIFMGGGTPSLLPAGHIAALLAAVSERFRFAPDIEVTLEANPGTIERGRFRDYRAAGVNRVSLGAQSFAAAQLERLGRIHSAADTRLAVEELRSAGLDNFNLDLMYALPEQDLAGALADLEQALALAPAHLSHYQLTLEPGTVFGGRPPAGLPDDDLAFEMQQACQERLAVAGWAQYEVSAYAPAARRCRHNLNYWQFGDYLGAGAGAHGKLTEVATGRIVRTEREREPRRYQRQAPQSPPTQRLLEPRALPFEFLMNALRLNQGFTLQAYRASTGQDAATLAPGLAASQKRGLIEESAGEHWQATPLGRRFLNDLVGAFLPDTPRGSAHLP